jgi:hypothetical protein
LATHLVVRQSCASEEPAGRIAVDDRGRRWTEFDGHETARVLALAVPCCESSLVAALGGVSVVDCEQSHNRRTRLLSGEHVLVNIDDSDDV